MCVTGPPVGGVCGACGAVGPPLPMPVPVTVPYPVPYPVPLPAPFPKRPHVPYPGEPLSPWKPRWYHGAWMEKGSRFRLPLQLVTRNKTTV